jgi:hypothetical protein
MRGGSRKRSPRVVRPRSTPPRSVLRKLPARNLCRFRGLPHRSGLLGTPWVGQSRVTSVTLNRLGERETAAIIARLVGNKELPADVMAEIVERTRSSLSIDARSVSGATRWRRLLAALADSILENFVQGEMQLGRSRRSIMRPPRRRRARGSSPRRGIERSAL